MTDLVWGLDGCVLCVLLFFVLLDEVVVVVQFFGHPEVELQSAIIFIKYG